MKKGFTLVEILGVIILLGVLSLILIPSIKNILGSAKNDTYDIQIKLIEGGLKNWSAENAFSLPQYNDDYITITLGELKTSGFIDVDVKNPENDLCFSNDTILKITKRNNKYIYEVVESSIEYFESDTCDVD